MLCGGCLQIPSYNGCGFVWWLIKGGGDDDATPDEIRDEAKEIFFNYCNYSYHEIKDED